MENEINDVYLKVDKLFNIKIKSQINGSGWIFKKFFHITNLVTDNSYYILEINEHLIRFNDLNELYDGMRKCIEQELIGIKEEVNYYQHPKTPSLINDKNFLFLKMEELGVREQKLSKLLDRINKKLSKE
jgi:hypothetical protein